MVNSRVNHEFSRIKETHPPPIAVSPRTASPSSEIVVRELRRYAAINPA